VVPIHYNIKLFPHISVETKISKFDDFFYDGESNVIINIHAARYIRLQKLKLDIVYLELFTKNNIIYKMEIIKHTLLANRNLFQQYITARALHPENVIYRLSKK